MPDTPEMVERVAAAIHQNPIATVGEELKPFASLSRDDQEYFRTAARAAIAAMREPTNMMLVNAGTVTNYDLESPSREPDRDHIEWWQAMIDEALGTPQAPPSASAGGR